MDGPHAKGTSKGKGSKDLGSPRSRRRWDRQGVEQRRGDRQDREEGGNHSREDPLEGRPGGTVKRVG